jgi:tetratricopeptide (TPR) repeat protein
VIPVVPGKNYTAMIAQTEVSQWIACAEGAAQNRDWREAIRCWEEVLRMAPERVAGYAGAGRALREAGRLDEARRVLDDGLERFPNNERLAVARAWIANALQDWQDAVVRWEAVRSSFPNDPWSYIGSVHALRAATRSTNCFRRPRR